MAFKVQTQIEIDAPASVVWDILIDLDGYSRWNPFIIEASGRIAPNAILEVSPQLAGKQQATFRPIVTSYADGKSFAWTGAIVHRWFATGVHSFEIKQVSANRVVVDHDEVFLGIGAPLVSLIGKKLTERGFIAMNEALKREAEAHQHA